MIKLFREAYPRQSSVYSVSKCTYSKCEVIVYTTLCTLVIMPWCARASEVYGSLLVCEFCLLCMTAVAAARCSAIATNL